MPSRFNKSRPGRYLLKRAVGHPLASINQLVSVHRAILYEKLGPGEHPCFHCGKTLRWYRGFDNQKKDDALHVDHLNHQTHDNCRENLVPCCRNCNQKRSRRAIKEGEPTVELSNGRLIRAVVRQCLNCGESFNIPPAMLKPRAGKNRGRYCSRTCMYNRNR